jgi:dihydroorotate dehydrogenase electron transfer subunit
LKPTQSTIAAAREICAGVFSLWLDAPEVARAIEPGQFVNVKVSPGVDPLLRRPISVADVDGGRLRLVFRVVGRGTELLSHVRAGDELDLLGPLGKPAPIERGAEAFLCGGGIGAAPLLFLARRLPGKSKPVVLLGAKEKAQLMLVKEFRALGCDVRIATDDGSSGHRGFVTELAGAAVKAARKPVVYACGPRPMLADLVKRVDPVEVWGFVEERMGCGTGICYCCALPKKTGGHVRFCEEGPVVKLNEVVL